MEALETVGAILGIVVVLAAALLPAMDERNRRKFISRETADDRAEKLKSDMDGMGRKIERNAGLFVQLDDRTGDLEEKVARIEERQTQQWERISEQMSQTARTIEQVTRELKEIADQQHRFALDMAANQRGNQN